jgi:hypothetical protein
MSMLDAIFGEDKDPQEKERWYVAVTARGFPPQIVRNMFDKVHHYGLANFIDRVCYEKGAFEQKEFYLFIGVTSTFKGSVPDEYKNGFDAFLKSLHLINQDISLSYDEIADWVGPEIEGRNIRQVKMIKIERRPPQFQDVFSEAETDRSGGSAESYDQLLYWMSLIGSGSWNLFRSTCETLGIAEKPSDASQLMRRLRALGHVELYENGRKWMMAPASLVECGRSTTTVQYFLAGKRSRTMIDALRKHMGLVENKSQPLANAPEHVLVEFGSVDQTERAVKRINRAGIGEFHIAGNSSMQLALNLPNIEQWKHTLTPLDGIVPSLYTIEQWQSPGDFVSLSGIPSETNLYRLERDSDADYTPIFSAFYDADSDTWLRGDWYGLRFLAIHYHTTEQLKVFYNGPDMQIAIPYDQRWPGIYERALVLASGLLPVKRGMWLIFDNISIDLANILTSKLDIDLKNSNE